MITMNPTLREKLERALTVRRRLGYTKLRLDRLMDNFTHDQLGDMTTGEIREVVDETMDKATSDETTEGRYHLVQGNHPATGQEMAFIKHTKALANNYAKMLRDCDYVVEVDEINVKDLVA